jgi:tRNA pseudouridine55 synthase
MESSGLYLIHKPTGITSFDCIRDLKRRLNRRDLGHGGTLDKFASGVLPVFAGEGLKLARFFLESYPSLSTHWKTYEGVFRFGTATDTADPEGIVIEHREVPTLSKERVQAAMQTFVETTYNQTPPRYSAKKIEGNRASDLARAGKELELKPVPVTIRRFTCTAVEGQDVFFEVECSKGTYVRALAEDLAAKLETVAHVRSLSRTAVGNFKLSDACTLENPTLLDMEQAVSFLPTFSLLPNEAEHIRVGQIQDLLARLANAGLEPNAYCAVAEVANTKAKPIALLELKSGRQAFFLRSFAFASL